MYTKLYGRKIFLIDFLHYNNGHYDFWKSCWIVDSIPIGFEIGIPLSRVYIRQPTWDPQFFALKNTVIFIVAGYCANNVQSLKEIHVWADLYPPPFQQSHFTTCECD